MSHDRRPSAASTSSSGSSDEEPEAERRRRRRKSTWERLGLLRGALECNGEPPPPMQGFVAKRRKWPMKGWHKRFFFLDEGLLRYARHLDDISRGKCHGKINIGLSAVAHKRDSRRINIDAENHLFHLKVKTVKEFDAWMEALRLHRIYQQHLITTDDVRVDKQTDSEQELSVGPDWSDKPVSVEHLDKELHDVQEDLVRLSCLLNQLRTAPPPPPSPRVETAPKSPGLLRRKAKDRTNAVPPSLTVPPLHLSASNPNLNESFPATAAFCGVSSGLADEFLVHATGVHDRLRTLYKQMHDLVRQAPSTPHKHADESQEPRERVQSVSGATSTGVDERRARLESLSPTESFSEFYDAASEFVSAASDDEDEGSDVYSDSEPEDEADEHDDRKILVAPKAGRRTRLPVPRPQTPNLSFWGFLRKNIGKDLSKVGFPVALNEPLSTLQRLCEELEYSDLLDKAAELADPAERMLHVAAFAIAGYSFLEARSGNKTFNPLMGETYECVREDRGWKFIAEQVSHHPPISACHCEAKNYVFWQDYRPRVKFWGRSIEVLPQGNVHLLLPLHGEHYVWSKATMCIHNVLSADSRWMDIYGEVDIVCNKMTCTLTFPRARSASDTKDEVFGVITDEHGQVVRQLFGKWNEALFCGTERKSAKCIWRMAALPDEHELYYGFTRFAIELNELDPALKALLPRTDTRFRPDQRALEEGRINDAETEKVRVEQMQRNRNKELEERGSKWTPAWFRKIEANDTWVANGKYWDARAHQFAHSNLVQLW